MILWSGIGGNDKLTGFGIQKRDSKLMSKLESVKLTRRSLSESS
jgi:hypothetical protein